MKRPSARHYLFGVNVVLLAFLVMSLARNSFLLLRPGREKGAPTNEIFAAQPNSSRKTLTEYMQFMSGRAVFGYGQQEEAQVQKRRMVDDLEYIGSSRTPKGYRAFLRNSVSSETYTIMSGDRVGEYQVQEITPHSVILTKAEEQVELKR